MKNRRIIRTIAILLVLFTSTVFTWFNSPSIAELRNVDFLKIFTGGVLMGVLITMLREMFNQKQVSNSDPKLQ